MITVEFDDWAWYDDNHAMLAGDDVTVYGIVDDDLYETRISGEIDLDVFEQREIIADSIVTLFDS